MPVRDTLTIDISSLVPELGARKDVFLGTISQPTFPAAEADIRLDGVSGERAPWQNATDLSTAWWVPFPANPTRLEFDFGRNSISNGEVSIEFFDRQCELENPEEEVLK
jgi:hypothetical protein